MLKFSSKETNFLCRFQLYIILGVCWRKSTLVSEQHHRAPIEEKLNMILMP